MFQYFGLVFLVFAERLKNKAMYSQNEFFVFLTFYSSVLMHELSHYVFSYISGGYPKNLTVVPVRNSYIGSNNNKIVSWEFGYVKSQNINFINSAIIGMAPLSLLMVGYFVYMDYFVYLEKSAINYFFYYVLLFSLISSSIPSVTDFKVAFSRPASILFSAGIFIFLYFNFNFIMEVFYDFKKNLFYIVN